MAYPEIERSFARFASAIEPGATSADRAARAHAALRQRLAADPRFGPQHLETFLAGSYKRHTAISPLKDVDIFVILDADQKLKPRLALDRLRRALDKHYSAKTAPSPRSCSPASRSRRSAAR